MATKDSTINFLLDQLAELEAAHAQKMFGDYCLYLGDKSVALVCDDRLYVKSTSAGRQHIPMPVEAYPYLGAQPHFLITAEHWLNKHWLSQLLQITASELPASNRMRRKKC